MDKNYRVRRDRLQDFGFRSGTSRRGFLETVSAGFGGVLVGLGALGAVVKGCLSLSDLVHAPNLIRDFPLASSITLQSSYGGRITELHTLARFHDEQLAEYRQLSEFFGVPVTLYTPGDISSEKNLKVMAVSKGGHPWMRDLFLSSDNGFVVTPYDQTGSGIIIREIAEHLSRDGNHITAAPFLFEGGQLLNMGNYTLASEHLRDPRSFLSDVVLDPYNCCDALQEEILGQTISLPSFIDEKNIAFSGHIDMYVTPLASDAILVADLNLGARILKGVDKQERQHYEQKIIKELNQERIAAGDTSYQINWNVLDIDRAQDNWYYQAVAKLFDKTARVLSKFYHVHRIPFFLSTNDETTDMAAFTYNNAIIEHNTGKAVVPVYGIPTLDTIALTTFKDAGYANILALNNLRGLTRKSGPHCDYLERRIV